MVQILADRYELGEELGAGGMGRVVRAHDRVLDRPVAVKLLHEHLARQPSVRERFMREARSAVRFSHANAVAVYDAGSEGRTFYIVMELIDGHTLADEVEQGPLEVDRAVHIASSTLEALAAAHANGIVHRDIKPANIMLLRHGGGSSQNGEAHSGVKLTDFGIAKGLTEAGEKTLTMTGQVFGTPHYLAPEQADGKPATPASDVYAMGIVLYEALTGAPPFDAESAFAVVIAHQNDEPPPVRRQRRDIDPALAAVVHRALKKDPKERYADAAQMRAALAELSRVRTPGKRPLQGVEPTRAAPAPAPPRRATQPAAPTPSAAPRGGGQWRLAVIVAVLALLVFAGVTLISALDGGGGGSGIDAPQPEVPEGTEPDAVPEDPEPQPEPDTEPEPEEPPPPSDTDPPGGEQSSDQQ